MESLQICHTAQQQNKIETMKYNYSNSNPLNTLREAISKALFLSIAIFCFLGCNSVWGQTATFTTTNTGNRSGTNGNPCVFSANPTQTTWTVPCGVSSVTIRCWGGGGGSGGTNTGGTRAGGGGGGGGYSESTLAVTPGDVLYVQVGERGFGGGADNTPCTNGASGGPGGISYVRTGAHAPGGTVRCLANGGGGGVGGSAGTAGAGAVAGTGNVWARTGGAGGAGSTSTARAGGGGGSGGPGGNGNPANSTTCSTCGTPATHNGRGGAAIAGNANNGAGATATSCGSACGNYNGVAPSVGYGGGAAGGTRNGSGRSGNQGAYGYVEISYTVSSTTAPSGGTKSPNAATVCAGAGVSFSGPTAGSGGVGCSDQYIWLINGVSQGSYTLGNTVGTSATAGQTITIQGRRGGCSGTGCDGSYADLATWTVIARPTSVVSGTANVCSGATTSTISVALTGAQPWALTWFDGTTSTNVTGIAASPYTFNVSPTGTTTYTTTALSDVNCTSQAGDRTGSATVTVNDNPTLTSVVPDPAATCEGYDVTVTLNGMLPSVNPSTVTYSIGLTTGLTATVSNVNGSGVGSFVITPTAAQSGATIEVTNISRTDVTPNCPTTFSISGTLPTVTPSPVITSQPSALTLCENGSGSFTAAASGSPTYQWYYSNTGLPGSWIITDAVGGLSGHTSGTLSLSSIPVSYNGFFVRCEATENGCTTPTNSVLLSVRATPTASIGGTTTVCQGVASPDITFTNGVALPVTVTYNVNGGSNTTVAIGAGIGATATVPQVTTAFGTFVYNLVSVAYTDNIPSGGCSNGLSGSATVTVLDNTAPTNDEATVSSLCWEPNGSNTYTITIKSSAASGLGGSTLGMMALINYQGTNASDNGPTNGGYFVWNTSLALLNAIPFAKDQMACTGGGFVAMYGLGYGNTACDLISAETSVSGNQRTVTFTVRPTVTFPSLVLNDVSVYSMNSCGVAAGWDNFDLNFNSVVSAITAQPANQTVCTGAGTATFTVAANGTANTYQWQEFISGWNNISDGGVYSGCTGATLTLTNPTIGLNGYRYRCIVSNALCNTSTSNGNATLTVTPLPSINPLTGTTSVCVGSTTTLGGNTIPNQVIQPFTSVGTTSFTPPFAGNVELLVVGGGGGGGARHAGGGGAGGFRYLASHSIARVQTVVVGSGGNGGNGTTLTGATNGGNSQFGSIISLGGGFGSTNGGAASSGGSGGGGSNNIMGKPGTGGQGNNGGNHGCNTASSDVNGCGSPQGGCAGAQCGGFGAGGGGAAAAGVNAALGVGSAGGAGISNSISGSAVTYGGGGGGGSSNATGYAGGAGGGGAGGTLSSVNGVNGTANTGSGGGGGGANGGTSGSGGNGGSGIVIVKYPVHEWTSSNTGVATVSSTGVVTGVAQGTTTITYRVFANGCYSEVSTLVTVNSLATPGSIQYAGTTQNICPGGTISSSNIVAPTNGGNGTLSVVWYCTEINSGTNPWIRSTSANALNTATGGGNALSLTNYSPEADFPGRTRFWILRRAYTDNCGECVSSICQDQLFTVELLPNATVAPISGASDVCVGSSTAFSSTPNATSYTITSINSSQTFTAPRNLLAATTSVLVVAGGGAGGQGRGGGGGGVIYNAAFAVPGGAYPVTVGAGGTGSASNAVYGKGGNSIFHTITAEGGGGGGSHFGTNVGQAGGSGGGAAINYAGGGPWAGGAASTTPSGQGNAGGRGAGSTNNPRNTGGGGGAGAAALIITTTTPAPNGGAGISNSITGSAVFYGGGGGGANGNAQGESNNTNGAGTGGNGGGGNGAPIGGNPTNGTPNTGGGGGGGGAGGASTTIGGSGGSGIVIIRWIDGEWTSDNPAVAMVDPATGVVTGISAGTTNINYTVIRNGICPVTVSRAITVNPIPTAAISPATATVCSGSPQTLTASGGGTYTWSNSGGTDADATFSPTSSTTYTVTVTNNGCTASESRTIRVPSNVSIPDITGDQTICESGGTTQFTVPFTDPTGGTITTIGSDYRVHTFTTNGDFGTSQPLSAEILVVGGGGSGGPAIGGGGGGGAVVYVPRGTVANATYPIVIGAGGVSTTANGASGGSSTAFGMTAFGGGSSGRHDVANGTNGGSGGGAGSNNAVLNTGGSAVPGSSSLGSFTGRIFGNSGGSMLVARLGGPTRAAGGGGAGAPALSVNSNFVGAGISNGGNGVQIDIDGTAHFWAGGGGGGAFFNGTAGNGGLGGGGGGAEQSGSVGVGGGSALNAGGDGGTLGDDGPGGNGGANTGGGGGGGTWDDGLGGTGGSGVVIVRYPIVTNGVWESSNTGVATVNSSGLVSAVGPGTATIRYHVILEGCTTTVARDVTVRPTPTASISGTTTVCQDGAEPDLTFTNPMTLPVTVTYTINGGSNQTVNVGASTTSNVPAPTGTAGDFVYSLVSVEYQAAPSCPTSISGSATITVRPTPTASISGTTTVCQDGASPDVTFTNPMALPVTVTYSVNGGGSQPVNIGANTTATVAQPTVAAGDFVYSLVSVAYQTTPNCDNMISGDATVTVRATPSLTGSDQEPAYCDGVANTVTLSGLVPSSVFNVGYTVSGGGQESSTATLSNSSGVATFQTIPLTMADNGQILQVNSLEYSTAPACAVNSFTQDLTILIRNAANNVNLASTTASAALQQCSDGPWTYYADNTYGTDKWIFAIDKNGNTFDAEVTITKIPEVSPGVPGVISHLYSNILGFEHGSYLLGRYWNVRMISGSINPAQPVRLRFYFDPAEKAAAEAERDAVAAFYSTLTSPNRVLTPFKWFKTVGVPFDPNRIVGNDFSAFNNIELTQDATGQENGVDYVQFNTITSFSGGGGGFGFGNLGVGLPVNMLYFTATAVKNSYIELKWATATETDNQGFEVQRSTDGVNFTKIGWVDGNGNSTSTKTYKFDDKDVDADVVYYYRLMQIDFDADFEYSNIASASIKGDNSVDVLGMYPNPTTGRVVIEVVLPNQQDVKVSLTDMLGRTMSDEAVTVSKGYSNIELDYSGVAAGTYTVSITSGTQVITKKLIISK